MSDPVNHPVHYTSGGRVECIDAIRAATEHLPGYEAFLTGQVLKYCWRWRLKSSPVQDLEKAQWYLTRLLEVAREDRPLGH